MLTEAIASVGRTGRHPAWGSAYSRGGGLALTAALAPTASSGGAQGTAEEDATRIVRQIVADFNALYRALVGPH